MNFIENVLIFKYRIVSSRCSKMVLLIIQIKNTMKEKGRLFFIWEQEPSLSCLQL